MPKQINPNQDNPSDYFLPLNDSEIQRVQLQDRMVTPELGPLLPKELVPTIHSVLDIACGPGGWALDVAAAYPDKEVTGIDISTKMTTYAQTQQQARGLSNARFQVMDALHLSSIPDASFDFINARTIQAFMHLADWPDFIAECWRITRSGGWLRLTESEAPFTNSSALEELYRLILQMMWKNELIYSPTGRQGGILPLLTAFLRQGKWQHIQHAAYAIDIGYDQQAHAQAFQDHKIGMDAIVPFLSRAYPDENIARLAQQALDEFKSEAFAGVWLFLAAWGQKI